MANHLELPIEVDEDLAEYDRDRSTYVPIDGPGVADSPEYRRIRAGLFPQWVDGASFRDRVERAMARAAAGRRHDQTIAVFCHGGVINVHLQQLLGLDRPLVFPIEYTAITRVLISRDGTRRVASVNETTHARDLLRRVTRG